MEVNISGADNVRGVELHLAFDPAVIEVLDGDESLTGIQMIPGDFLDIDQGFVAINQADNLLGKIDYTIVLLGPAQPVSGSGNLITFEIKAIADGSSKIDINESILTSADGNSLPFVAQDGLVIVDIEESATLTMPPTSTSTLRSVPPPTQLPSATLTHILLPVPTPSVSRVVTTIQASLSPTIQQQTLITKGAISTPTALTQVNEMTNTPVATQAINTTPVIEEQLEIRAITGDDSGKGIDNESNVTNLIIVLLIVWITIFLLSGLFYWALRASNQSRNDRSP
jgi:hypothetical protein